MRRSRHDMFGEAPKLGAISSILCHHILSYKKEKGTQREGTHAGPGQSNRIFKFHLLSCSGGCGRVLECVFRLRMAAQALKSAFAANVGQRSRGGSEISWSGSCDEMMT